MNKLAKLIADGTITVEELANASELIERAKLVTEGLEACKKTLVFPLGIEKMTCYSYLNPLTGYLSWGTYAIDGTVTFSSNWGKKEEIGSCNLTKFSDVFMALENDGEDDEFAYNLRSFLRREIETANAIYSKNRILA